MKLVIEVWKFANGDDEVWTFANGAETELIETREFPHANEDARAFVWDRLERGHCLRMWRR